MEYRTYCTNKEENNLTLKFYGKDNEKIELERRTSKRDIKTIENGSLVVTKIESRSRRKSAPKPYTTSVLQQDAANKLYFTTKKTMMVAQELYEGIDVKGEMEQ